MSQLRRWPTPQSIYSDWTDSRPPGATISIHALAKPLSRFLYHRQAADIIVKNAKPPLSVATVEVLSTYLTLKNISPSTRVLVLRHFSLRARNAREDAQVVLDSNLLGLVPELLRSSSPDILFATCNLLKSLGRYREMKNKIHSDLVSLLNHRDPCVQKSAVYALDALNLVETLLRHLITNKLSPANRMYTLHVLHVRVGKDEQHARLIVECSSLKNCFSMLLQSPDPRILEHTCRILLNLLKYRRLTTAVADLELDKLFLPATPNINNPSGASRLDENRQWAVTKLVERLKQRSAMERLPHSWDGIMAEG
ncbi:hypothetical protein B0H16DRAFT_1894474 [Mycena metata]|uniref:Uncharacterized protein n=1 Tax=Mycena metata TaxID=1033252 RepID=A0AAD7HSS9_9AGAR|nr:hypothetical protein B0H16DRAFT_1894474 [Mycena metata]